MTKRLMKIGFVGILGAVLLGLAACAATDVSTSNRTGDSASFNPYTDGEIPEALKAYLDENGLDLCQIGIGTCENMTPITSQSTPRMTSGCLCGDSDDSGVVDIKDISYLVNHFFFGESGPSFSECSNFNRDQILNSIDLAILIEFVFSNISDSDDLSCFELDPGGDNPPPDDGETLYVSNTPPCDNSGPGTYTLPLCDITTANSRANGGMTVYILPGIYNEMIIPKSGTPGNPTVYSGYGGDRTKVILSGGEEVQSWEHVSGNIYRARFDAPSQCRLINGAFQSVRSTHCWEDRKLWFKRAAEPNSSNLSGGSLSDMDEPGKFFYDSSSGFVYVWTHDGDHPSQHLIECAKSDILSVGEYTPYPAVEHFTLKNLTVMQTNGRGLSFDGYSHNITIQNNEIMLTGGSGYCGGNPSAIYHGTSGNYLPDSPNFNIIGNSIHDVGSDRGAWNHHEGQHTGAAINLYSVLNSRIEDNTIYNANEGMYLKFGNAGMKIRNNKIFSTKEGIEMGQMEQGVIAPSDLIEGNRVYNTLACGLSNVRGNQHYVAKNNTFWNTAGVCATTEVDQPERNANVFVTLTANIIGNASDHGRAYLSFQWGSVANAVSDFNLFSNLRFQTNPQSYLQTNSTTYTTLSAWQAATGQDLNSVFDTPTFVSLDPNNAGFLKPTPGSTACTTGPGGTHLGAVPCD